MLTTFRPSEALSNYVLHYFTLDWKKPNGQSKVKQLCLPTGCSVLGFHLKGRMKVDIDNRIIETKKHYVIAQTTRPFFMIADEDLYVLVVCLKPTALFHLLGIDLQPLVNEGGDIFSLFGERMKTLEKELEKSNDIQHQIKLLETLLLNQLSIHASKPNFIDISVDLIIENKGCISVKGLIDKLGVSERYFQRKFKMMVGISPSTYINIIRYNFIFAALNHNSLDDWKNATAQFNFYDGPHFSHSFKNLFGKSPSDFDINEHPFLKISAVENSLWLFPFKHSSS